MAVFIVEAPKFVLENELRLLDCGMFSEVLRQAGYADEVRATLHDSSRILVI